MDIRIIKLNVPKDASNEEIDEKIAEAVHASLDDAEDEEIDICKGCKKEKSCSDDRKSKHREMHRAFQSFKNAFENTLEAMDELTDPGDFAKVLDKLSEKSKALADLLRPKK